MVPTPGTFETEISFLCVTLWQLQFTYYKQPIGRWTIRKLRIGEFSAINNGSVVSNIQSDETRRCHCHSGSVDEVAQADVLWHVG